MFSWLENISRAFRRVNQTETTHWRRLASGLLVPVDSEIDVTRRDKHTLLDGKEFALQVEAIFADAGLPLDVERHDLAIRLKKAKDISDNYLLGVDELPWQDIFDAMMARRICDSVIAMRDRISQEHLKKLQEGSLDLLARDDQSKAKNFLWELEMLQALRIRGIDAVLAEPDITAEIDGYSLGVACKKTYFEGLLPERLEKAAKQLGDKFDVRIAAFNADELIEHEVILKTRTSEEATKVLGQYCHDFLQRHSDLFKEYLLSGKLTAILVSTAAINEAVDDTPSLYNARQFSIWAPPPLSGDKVKALETFTEAFGR